MRLINAESRPVDVALCVDETALNRLRPVLRHLCVALVDYPVRLRLVSSTPSVESLTLGPVQALVHRRIRWPVARRRLQELTQALRAEPPDVVHAASGESFELARDLALRLDAEWLVDVSSIPDVERLERLAGGRHPHVIAFSEPLVEFLQRDRAAPADRIHLIRPGVIASKEAACFADSTRTPTILAVQPLSRDSRTETLIAALALLRNDGLSFSAFLLGQGPREAGLRRRVRQERLTNHVTFAALQAGIGEVLQESDLLVVTHPLNEVSIRVLQAMAAGVLVVCPPSPVQDALRDGKTARCFHEMTPRAVSGTLREILTDRAAARCIAAAGQAHVREHHTVSHMAERTTEVYRRVRARAAV